MEIRMAKTSRKGRLSQLGLFGERVVLPRWHDLTDTTRLEALRLLAQLLVGVRAENPSRAPQSRGERDE
jgi:hypothetical protein